MTKVIKKILITVFSALFLICAFLALYNPAAVQTARADAANTPANDYTEEWSLADDNFNFTAGAYMGAIKNDEFMLGFGLNVDNSEFLNLNNFPGAIYRDHLDPVTPAALNLFYYEFTIYRGNDFDFNSKKLYTIGVLMNSYNTDGSEFYVTLYEKQWSITDDVYFDINKPSVSGNIIKTDGTTVVNGTEYSVIEEYITSDPAFFGGFSSAAFKFNPASYFNNYFVTFNYGYTITTGIGLFNNTTKKYNNTIASSARSAYGIINTMNDLGVLEEEIRSLPANENDSLLNLANSILTEGSKTTVTLEYLTEIEGTVFARKNSVQIEVPVINNDIKIDDVNYYLESNGKAPLEEKCIDSNLYDIVYDSERNVYKTYYLKNVWLRTITTDGKYFDYFLDINQSYYDFYSPIVETGAFSQDLFEYFYSALILNEFPQLTGMTTDEVYGYFGFAVLPETLTLNTLFAEILDVSGTKSGIIEYFTYENLITYEEHRALLENFNYNWLSQAWDGLAGFVAGGEWRADYYIFYTDSDSGYIGQADVDDPENPDGVIKDEVLDPVIGAVDNVFSAAGDIFNNFIDLVGGLFGGGSNWIYILLVVAAVVIFIIFIKKSKN